jgi:hypothetical protein
LIHVNPPPSGFVFWTKEISHPNGRRITMAGKGRSMRRSGYPGRGASMSTEVEPGPAPKRLRIRYEDDPVVMTVDGQDFRVRARTGEPGVYDFDWLSGPHDYGFTSAGGDRTPLTPQEAEEHIRGFLAQINPATGYID